MGNTFNNSTILVVGGAGFVGSNLVKMILNETDAVNITVVDNLLSSEKENLPNDKRLTFLHGSITNDAILSELPDKFDYVFHLATYHGNQSSIHNPLTDHENNTLTTLKLMYHVASFKNLKKLVYSSAGCSVAVKTFENATATKEENIVDITQQDSPYSISKIIGEFYAVYFHKQHQVPTVRARFQNVYGPGEVLGAGQWRGTPATVWRNVTPTFIYKALNNIPLSLENNGIASRDFIYVEDICRGLMACALKGKAGDVYNIASGVETTILELATLINKFSNNTAGFEHLPKRAWDNSGKRFGSPEKAKRELGFEAKMNLTQGIEKTIAWTKENLAFIDTQIQKHNKEMSQ